MSSDASSIGVAAVVVTFNRLGLLQRLLTRLRTLSALDTILVVDNTSTDGTGEWLAELCAAEPRVQYRTLPVNVGGAGGFEAGLQWSHDLGAELSWARARIRLTLAFQRSASESWPAAENSTP